MVSENEQALLTGTSENVRDFVDSDRCMVVDWRSREDEVIDEAIRFLPEGSLTYETSFPGTDTVEVRLRFGDREDVISLPFQPQNNFRVLLRVWKLLQPVYDIELFCCTDGSDTHGFLLRPAEWWEDYRASYPEQYAKVFRHVSDLNQLWELDQPTKGDSTKSKPWWRFWG